MLRLELTGGEVWEPHNIGGEFEGTVTIRDARADEWSEVGDLVVKAYERAGLMSEDGYLDHIRDDLADVEVPCPGITRCFGGCSELRPGRATTSQSGRGTPSPTRPAGLVLPVTDDTTG